VSAKGSGIAKIIYGGITALATLFGLVTFLTGRQSIGEFLPTPTAPQIGERIITATPGSSFTGASFAAQPTAVPPATTAPQPTAASSAQVCGALAPRLRVGGNGRVFRHPNENNRVRSEPGLAGRQIGVILAGDEFYVAAGPRCVDDVIWWFVEYGGMEGWTAEGLGDRYYVEPS
jgi:hypothetical protein